MLTFFCKHFLDSTRAEPEMKAAKRVDKRVHSPDSDDGNEKAADDDEGLFDYNKNTTQIPSTFETPFTSVAGEQSNGAYSPEQTDSGRAKPLQTHSTVARQAKKIRKVQN